MKSHLEGADHTHVWGWAWNDMLPAPVLVRVIVDGVAVAEVAATAYRSDLAAAGIGDGIAGFEVNFPEPLDPENAHEICVYGDGEPLQGSPVKLASGLSSPASAPNACANATLGAAGGIRSNLEGADHTRVWGWAWNSSLPSQPVRILVKVDGATMAEVAATAYREDLAAAGIGDGAAGFEVDLPEILDTERAHEISVYGDGEALQGSPVKLAAGLPMPASVLSNLRAAILGAVGAARSEVEFASVLAVLEEETSEARFPKRLGGFGGNLALVIDDAIPRASRDAGSQAVLSHMACLRRLGFEVVFVQGGDAAADPEAEADLRAQGIACLSRDVIGGPDVALRGLRGRVALVYLHRLSNAARWLSVARAWCPGARIVYSLADLHSLRLARMHAVLGGEPPTGVQNAERQLIATADLVLTHSRVEAALLEQDVPKARVHVVPWSVQPRAAGASAREGVAFIGSYGHAPNRDAAAWLVEEIVPRVHALDPSIGFKLAGSGMPAGLAARARPGLNMLGWVPDIAALLDSVRLTVAPMRFGAGVNGKVLDSLAAGVPCLATPIAMAGLGVPPGLEECVADGAEAFAQAIVRLHGAPQHLRELGRIGQSWVASTLSEERIDAAMRAALG